MKKYTKEYKKQLLEKLELWALENKINMLQLSKELGISYSTVYNWFSFNRLPKKLWTYQIEKFLKQKGVIK